MIFHLGRMLVKNGLYLRKGFRKIGHRYIIFKFNGAWGGTGKKNGKSAKFGRKLVSFHIFNQILLVLPRFLYNFTFLQKFPLKVIKTRYSKGSGKKLVPLKNIYLRKRCYVKKHFIHFTTKKAIDPTYFSYIWPFLRSHLCQFEFHSSHIR